jgi:hypothetical protein
MHRRNLVIFSLDPVTQSIDKEWSSFSASQSYVTRAAMDTVRLQLNIIANALPETSKQNVSSPSVPNKSAPEQEELTVSSLLFLINILTPFQAAKPRVILDIPAPDSPQWTPITPVRPPSGVTKRQSTTTKKFRPPSHPSHQAQGSSELSTVPSSSQSSGTPVPDVTLMQSSVSSHHLKTPG